MLKMIVNGVMLLVCVTLGIKIAGKIVKLIFFLIAACAIVNLLSCGGIL